MNDDVLCIKKMHHFDAADTQHVGSHRPVAAAPHRFRPGTVHFSVDLV